MESADNYNFNLFRPRNKHGRKNRNVILSMLSIWAVAVFGFQILLRVIEKPVPEKTLEMFETTWPKIKTNDFQSVDYKKFLNSLVLVRGKNTVKPADQKVLSEAISTITFAIVPDSIKALITNEIANLNNLKAELVNTRDEDYIRTKAMITEANKSLINATEPYTDFKSGSLEAAIFTACIVDNYPLTFDDAVYEKLPEIMQLYLIHYQSILTDSKILGFPFHYFYTAVFLLILFIVLCIVYNVLIEWRLKKEGIVE